MKYKHSTSNLFLLLLMYAFTFSTALAQTSGLTGESQTDFIVKKTTINALVPAQGKTLSTVIIKGKDFENIAQVKFNGTRANEFSVNDQGTEITAKVPEGATSGPVTVVPEYEEAVSQDPFTLYQLKLNRFSPGSGKIGDIITLYGENLENLFTVFFNGVPTTNFTTNDNFKQATVTVPENATTGPIGIKDLTDTVYSKATFTVGAPPTITAFTPDTGPLSTSVTITGTNFTGVTQVAFNGVATTDVPTTNATGNSITVAVPAGATTGKIKVTTPNGVVESNGDFTVTIHQEVNQIVVICRSQPYANDDPIITCDSSTNISGQTFMLGQIPVTFGPQSPDGTYPFNGNIINGNESFCYTSNSGGFTECQFISPSLFFVVTIHRYDARFSGINTIDIKSAPISNDMDVKQLTLHPNPTTGNTTLTLLDAKAVAQVSIADMAGRVLWSANTFENSTVLLPVAGFTTGNYLVIVVYKNNERETLKLIKQ